MKAEIEADVPDGWRAVAYRLPNSGEFYLAARGVLQLTTTSNSPWLILERVEPKRESRWINAYHEHEYESFEYANSRAGSHRFACIRIDYEDGKLVAVTLEPEGGVRDE